MAKPILSKKKQAVMNEIIRMSKEYDEAAKIAERTGRDLVGYRTIQQAYMDASADYREAFGIRWQLCPVFKAYNAK